MSQTVKQIINQLSLVMNVEADIAKACLVAEIHPELAKVLLRMHTSQKEIEKSINDYRGIAMSQAQLLDKLVDSSNDVMSIMDKLCEKGGYSPEELFDSVETSN